MSDMMDRLLSMELPKPEEARVRLPRLGLEMTLRELSYERLRAIRQKPDPQVQYILASVTDPDLTSERWYKGRLGCPTPAEALKKLLKAGEMELLTRRCDQLNGYEAGAVVDAPNEMFTDAALAAATEETEKN